MLLDEIIEILSQEKASLTDALLKTKILLHQIGKKELVQWVNNQVNALRADYSSGLTYSMVYPLHPGHPTLGINPG